MPMSQPDPDRDFPWWLVILALAGAGTLAAMLANSNYAQVLTTLMRGVWTTVFVTFVAFGLAAALGLLLALASTARLKAVRQAARLYVELIRGVPIIVMLLYVAFVGVPALVGGWNALASQLGAPPLLTRDVSLLWRAVFALMIAYSSFLAEVFRAGLQSVDRGQIEAAESLGLSRWLRFRLVVLPQAFRTILPPLGNDFVSMVKDSSLVSVLGVTDITQLGKVTAAANFRYLETYNVVAFLYLVMTISLSLALRRLETHLRRKGAR